MNDIIENMDDMEDGILGFEIFETMEIMSEIEAIVKGKTIADYVEALNTDEGLKIFEKVTEMSLSPEEMEIAFAEEKELNPEIYETLLNDKTEFSVDDLVGFFQSLNLVLSIPLVTDKLAKAKTVAEHIEILNDDELYEEVMKEFDIDLTAEDEK